VFARVIPGLRAVGVLDRALQCLRPGSDDAVRVLVSTNKGGSILGARIAGEIGFWCGLDFALGSRVDDSWPPPSDVLPTRLDADILFAVGNLDTWRDFAPLSGRRSLCVVVARDPFGRFRSMFMYAAEGGESGFRAIARRLSALGTDYAKAVDLLYRGTHRAPWD